MFEHKAPETKCVPSTVESVLRETVALLKDQLEQKRLWYEQALKDSQERVAALEQGRANWHAREKRLVAALAQAAAEANCHNCNEEHKTDGDDINTWLDLVQA